MAGLGLDEPVTIREGVVVALGEVLLVPGLFDE